MKVTRRSLLQGASALALTGGPANAGGFSMVQLGNPPVVISQGGMSNLPIGGIGFTRGMMMAQDGTMYTWNDSTGPYKGNTQSIPGKNTAPFTAWLAVLNGNNFPSSWLQAPTPYLGQGCVEIACSPTNSNFVLAMICGKTGQAITNLFKSTDGGATWTQTAYPTNSANSNGFTPPQKPGTYAQTICIDPNNTNIAWVSDGTTTRVTTDGGTTWNTNSSLPSSSGACTAMCYDTTSGTTGGSTNRLIVGSFGNGVYVSTNAFNGSTATFSLISGSITKPGEGRIGSDGTYYCTDGNAAAGIYRLTTANAWSQIYSVSGAVTSIAVDPNNPARVMGWDAGGTGPVILCTTPANTTAAGSMTWAQSGGKSITSTPDSPLVAAAFNSGSGLTFLTAGTGLWFDPWTTTSSSSVTIAGSGSVSFTVPAGIPNITTGRTLRATNTGTPSNYMIGTVASYSGTTLTLTIIGSAQLGLLPGPSGGSGTFSAWTISAERVYQVGGVGGGMVFADGFVTGSQNVGSCVYGIEGSAISDVVWPVGGNPCLCAQDRDLFQIPTNPFNATAGVVTGYGFVAYSNATFPQLGVTAVSPSDPTFWIGASSGGFYVNTNKGIAGSWSQTSSQPTAFSGPVACGNSNVFVSAGSTQAGSSTGIQYTQNGGTSSWSTMPSPAPTSGWHVGGLDDTSHTLDLDTTTTGPFVFYGYNAGDGHVYKMSVPTGGTPTVTQGFQILTNLGIQEVGPGCKLQCVPGHTGHMFWCPGGVDNSTSLSQIFSTHPNGGLVTNSYTLLWFSSNSAGAFTTLSTTQEVLSFAIGAPSTDPGSSGYPTIYIAGWAGSGQYGIYKCINFNSASLGSETWTLVTNFPTAYGVSQPYGMGADPNQEGRFIVGTNGNGAFIFQEAGKTNSWF